MDRLLALASGRPLALAVIPDGNLPALAKRLVGEGHVTVGQHGVDHLDRRAPGQPPSEYVEPPNDDEFTASISAGRRRLVEAGLHPVFYTPPWNAVEPGLETAVAAAGLPILSAGAAGPGEWTAEVDVLRWKGGARFKGAGRTAAELAEALRARRLTFQWTRPVGLLTHHLDHDPATWRYLARTLPRLDRDVDWVRIGEPPSREPPTPMAPRQGL